MAETMIRHPDKIERYLANYESVPELISQTWDRDGSMVVFAALCNRDALTDAPGLQSTLAEADIRLARALANAPSDWRDRTAQWAAKSAFAASAWWLTVRTISRQTAGIATTTSDLFAPFADLWASVGDDHHQDDSEPLVKVERFRKGLGTGIGAVVSDFRERPEFEGRDLNVVPYQTVQFPGSVNLGFVLRHQASSDMFGAMDTDSQDVTRTYVDAMSLIAEQGPEADLSAIVSTEESRDRLLGAFREVRLSLAARATLRLHAAEAITRKTAIITNPKGRRPYVRRSRLVTLTGVIRGIDLDEEKIILRNDGGRIRTVVRYSGQGLLAPQVDPRRLLDRHVSIPVHTNDASVVPGHAEIRGEVTVIGED